MSLDELPGQFEAFVERARTALDREIAAGKNLVAASNAEKTSAMNSLTALQAQVKAAEDQLTAMTEDLHRLSGLVGAHHEIAAAKKAVQKLTTEKAALETSIAALAKQRTEAEAKLVSLGNEAQRMINIRVEGETVMANLRAQLAQVQLGQRP